MVRLKTRKYKNQQNYKNIILEFNRSLKLISDTGLLKDYISTKIKQATNSRQVYFFLFNAELNRFFINGDPQLHRDIYITPNDKLIHWLNSNETHLDLKKSFGIKSFFSERENQLLEQLDAMLIYPLRVMNQIKGIVMLTNKTDGKKFNPDETTLLAALIDQASFAMENAFLYQQQSDRLKRMFHTDKMSIMGQLAAGAAHEIRNPLTSIRSTIQYIKKDISDPGKKQLITNLLGEVDRINEIIQGLLSFARPNIPQVETVDLNFVIQETVQLITTTAKKKNIKLQYNNHSKNQIIKADPGQLKQVLLNILINSIQAIKDQGEINISIEENENASHVSYAIEEEIYIIISDNGKGIEEENIDKIFDPFYTTKDEGTGLGLSISYGIINKHGGDVKIKSQVGKGTTVIISLPRFLGKNIENDTISSQ